MIRNETRKGFLHDVFVTAIEGGGCGTDSWATIRSYRWSLGKPKFERDLDAFKAVICHDDDWDNAVQTIGKDGSTRPSRPDVVALVEERGQWMTIDADVIAKGIGRITRGEVRLNSAIVAEVKLASKDNDAGVLDAISADAIVQAALLDELVYG